MTVRHAGTWNLRQGRKVSVVVDEVIRLLTDFDLDWLAVQEAADYVDELAEALKPHGYAVVTDWGGGTSGRDSAIIVRVTVPHRAMRRHRLERRGWERQPGRFGLHWPRSAVSLIIDEVRVLDYHGPPGPYRTKAYWRRTRAMLTSQRTAARLCRRWTRWGREWMLVGDINQTRAEALHWWRDRLRAAHTAGEGIDWAAMSAGVRVSSWEALTSFRHRGDHDPKLFTYSV